MKQSITTETLFRYELEQEDIEKIVLEHLGFSASKATTKWSSYDNTSLIVEVKTKEEEEE